MTYKEKKGNLLENIIAMLDILLIFITYEWRF